MRGKQITRANQIFVFVLPLVIFITALFFGQTFDASHDGQDYHSGAVIELANGWNPWKTSTLPIQLPDATTFVIGYPKLLWIIQTEIYTLTQHLNSATMTNLIVGLIAFVFVYGALSRLRISCSLRGFGAKFYPTIFYVHGRWI
jgi:hypothetical protein